MESASEDSRKAFIKALLADQFARQVQRIELTGGGNNNHVYYVYLDESSSDPQSLPSKPGLSPLPTETAKNEVAAISLIKDALSAYPSRIIPSVFGWGSDSSLGSALESYSWILEEFIPGEPLDKIFSALSSEQKRFIIQQIAQHYGGLGFAEGEVISGPLTIPLGGPFATYEEIYIQNFVTQLKNAENSEMIDGWRDDDRLRKRLDIFHHRATIEDLLKPLEDRRRTLIHGDLDLQNILIDPTTLHLTALLDFDFSHIASPADEFFYSFSLVHGILTGPFEEAEMELLRAAQLHGFAKIGELPSSASGDDSPVDWEVAKIWDEELTSAGVKKPSNITGIEELAELYWFCIDVCPPFFEMPRWLARRTPEQQKKAKNGAKACLVKYLNRWNI
ncbi:kinase-like domain-containing protein [Lipomyces doorenjongii]